MRLFDRTFRLVAYRQPVGFIGANPDFFERLDNGLEITDLRVQFNVSKGIGKSPNEADVTITNLSERTRAELQHRPLTVALEAGYDGVARALFLGNLKYGSSKLDGTDWETKLQLADGGRAYAHARVNRSYKAGTPLQVVLRDAAKAMGLALPRTAEAAPELAAAIASGEVLEGRARDELTRLLAPYGYGWSVQDGKLQILRADQVREDAAWSISSEHGLVGSPEYNAPDKKASRPTLTFTCLLFPELTPGGKVDLEAVGVRGLHRIQAVKHRGDTAGGEWVTEVEARQL